MTTRRRFLQGLVFLPLGELLAKYLSEDKEFIGGRRWGKGQLAATKQTMGAGLVSDTILGLPVVWKEGPTIKTGDIVLAPLSWYDTHRVDGSPRKQKINMVNSNE